MALPATRRGVNEFEVDEFGNLIKVKILNKEVTENKAFLDRLQNEGYAPKNLINLNKTIQGILDFTTGDVGSSDRWITTDYIEVKPNTYYSFQIENATDNYVVRLNQYNSNKEIIPNSYATNILGVSGNTFYKIKSNTSANYIRISFGRNNKATTLSQYEADGHWIMMTEGESEKTFTPYAPPNTEITLLKSNLDNISKKNSLSISGTSEYISGYITATSVNGIVYVDFKGVQTIKQVPAWTTFGTISNAQINNTTMYGIVSDESGNCYPISINASGQMKAVKDIPNGKNIYGTLISF